MTSTEIPEDLPDPTGARLSLPKSRRQGWWKDPAQSHPFAVRYHDGTQWTDFVCLVARTNIGPITRVPLPAEGAE